MSTVTFLSFFVLFFCSGHIKKVGKYLQEHINSYPIQWCKDFLLFVKAGDTHWSLLIQLHWICLRVWVIPVFGNTWQCNMRISMHESFSKIMTVNLWSLGLSFRNRYGPSGMGYDDSELGLVAHKRATCKAILI